jgi:hypothetical protein
MKRGTGVRCYKNKITVSLYSRCGCGKYNNPRYVGCVCDKCGMEVKHETKIDIPKDIMLYYQVDYFLTNPK